MIDFDPLRRSLNREMDRREFLKNLGAFLVALTGITAIIRTLASQFEPTKKRRKSNRIKTGHGYGSGPYEG